MSKIEWTEQTWNPIVGCQIASEGCRNCYAVNMANRLQSMGTRGYSGVVRRMQNGSIQWSGNVAFVPEALNKPLERKKPTVFFVNSMSDLFHQDVTASTIQSVLSIIKQTEQHRYLILTKRAERMRDYFRNKTIPKNVWLGVSVENKAAIQRIHHLQGINAPHRFLSIEPLLEDLGTLNLKGIQWVIVGGESGNAARPMCSEWVENIFTQCQAANVPFFFKQIIERRVCDEKAYIITLSLLSLLYFKFFYSL